MEAIELRARREALGMSQADLSKFLGTTQATISRWEGGKSPVGAAVSTELHELEALLVELVDNMVEAVEDVLASGQLPALVTHATDESFWSAHPEHEGTPALLHRVATATARSQIREDSGEDIPIVAMS